MANRFGAVIHASTAFVPQSSPAAQTTPKTSPHRMPIIARCMASLLEEGHARGEAVDEVLAADGAEFALREEPRDRDRPRLPAHGRGVVVRRGEQPRPAPVAAEHQRGGGPAFVGADVRLEHLAQVLVGAGGVAYLELDRLADAD